MKIVKEDKLYKNTIGSLKYANESNETKSIITIFDLVRLNGNSITMADFIVYLDKLAELGILKKHVSDKDFVTYNINKISLLNKNGREPRKKD